MHLMEKQNLDRAEGLEKALRAVFGPGKTTRELAQLLAYSLSKGALSYQEIKGIIKDDPGDVLLLAEGLRLLLPVRTKRSSSWEDRLLLLKHGEIYETPNIVRSLVKHALDTGRWDPEKAITELFKELEDPLGKKIHGLVMNIAEEAVNHTISGDQIKRICLQHGTGNRVDRLIAELKAAGIISPKLRSIPEVNREGSPIYELNPSVAVGKSP
jgi:hypothetical protein